MSVFEGKLEEFDEFNEKIIDNEKKKNDYDFDDYDEVNRILEGIVSDKTSNDELQELSEKEKEQLKENIKKLKRRLPDMFEDSQNIQNQGNDLTKEIEDLKAIREQIEEEQNNMHM